MLLQEPPSVQSVSEESQAGLAPGDQQDALSESGAQTAPQTRKRRERRGLPRPGRGETPREVTPTVVSIAEAADKEHKRSDVTISTAGVAAVDGTQKAASGTRAGAGGEHSFPRERSEVTSSTASVPQGASTDDCLSATNTTPSTVTTKSASPSERVGCSPSGDHLRKLNLLARVVTRRQAQREGELDRRRMISPPHYLSLQLKTNSRWL
jgi:hypothetical protein